MNLTIVRIATWISLCLYLLELRSKSLRSFHNSELYLLKETTDGYLSSTCLHQCQACFSALGKEGA